MRQVMLPLPPISQAKMVKHVVENNAHINPFRNTILSVELVRGYLQGVCVMWSGASFHLGFIAHQSDRSVSLDVQ